METIVKRKWARDVQPNIVSRLADYIRENASTLTEAKQMAFAMTYDLDKGNNFPAPTNAQFIIIRDTIIADKAFTIDECKQMIYWGVNIRGSAHKPNSGQMQEVFKFFNDNKPRGVHDEVDNYLENDITNIQDGSDFSRPSALRMIIKRATAKLEAESNG